MKRALILLNRNNKIFNHGGHGEHGENQAYQAPRALRVPRGSSLRLIVAWSGLAFWLVFWATSVSAQQPAAVQSPEVGADRRVTFRLNAPKAQEVALTGEFLKGKTPMVKDASGVWTVTVGPIEPEIYHYNFTVDGVRIIDPANPNLKTGSTASTLASVLEVRGDAPSFYDAQNVPPAARRSVCRNSSSKRRQKRRIDRVVESAEPDNGDGLTSLAGGYHISCFLQLVMTDIYEA